MSNYEVKRKMIAGEMNLIIPSKIAALVNSGLITAHCYASANGIDSYYRYTDPGKSHERFDAKSIMDALSGAPQDSQGVFESDSQRRLAERRPVDRSSDSELEEVMDEFGSLVVSNATRLRVPTTFAEAEILVSDRGLDRFRIQGVLNFLPRSSLTERDFKRPIDNLVARAWLVARERGEARMFGTIGNQMKSYGCNSLKEWWAASRPIDKVILLSDRKYLDADGLAYEKVNKISHLLCPF